MKDLIINNTEIGTDEQGRFSLNDLHKAAGGLNKHKPSLFYRSANFSEFIEVLNAQNRAFDPIVKKQGRYNGGTWVCRELVYKYAMWVNPEFEVKVIQTFDSITRSINAPTVMDALNELTAKIEGDAKVASYCGRELARYKRIRKENEDTFREEVEKAQLTLGFKK
ncbi:MAG: KilA-N domain-containing protein [Marinomonas gallaica]